MDPFLIIIIAFIVGGAGLSLYNSYKVKAIGGFTNEERIELVLEFAPKAVAAASQIFKLTVGSDKDTINSERKQYAVSLLTTLAKQVGLTLSDDLLILISGAIEGAVKIQK